MPERDGQAVGGYVGPPEVFGLRWGAGKIVGTRRGERRLTKAPATEAFEEAWDVAASDLADAGFAWENMDVVAYWERLDLDRGALAALIDSLPSRVAARQAEERQRAHERQERIAQEAAELAERDARDIEEAREAARVSLRDRRWSWAKGSLVDEAQELVARQDLDRDGASRLLALVEMARKNVARAEERTSRPHGPEMARAADPVIQAAARSAVAAITHEDEDWASIENGVGWSKATTCDGHVLAGLDSWTTEQASHALRLLRVHRRQIHVTTRETLFPAAPLSISTAA